MVLFFTFDDGAGPGVDSEDPAGTGDKSLRILKSQGYTFPAMDC